MSIYLLKPRFQALLRPAVGVLHAAGVTANQMTVAACVISVALGLGLFVLQPGAAAFALVPAWMLLRMAFNAIDGLLAREFGQASKLGALLNEVTDVISDAAIYLPFALVAPLGGFWVGAVIFAAALSEFAGVLAQAIGAPRRYDGPMGKGDRAVVFGALGLWLGLGFELPAAAAVVMPLVTALIVLTTVRRLRGALQTAV